MLVRLAFSVATAIEPEILIVDEVLSAGDHSFQAKAQQRMQALISHAQAVVVVSHDLVSLTRMCSRILWLDHGRIQHVGPGRRGHSRLHGLHAREFAAAGGVRRMKIFRVGILGFGMIGKVHAYGYATLPFYYDPPPLSARITHVVTSRAETAEKARRLIGADVAATDFRAVTENPDVDIVHVCTPNDRHCEALLSAIAHQKHIYCDKPLVATWDEARQVAAALESYRGTAQMTFQNRFFPATLRAKQLLDEGRLGRVLQFRAAYLHAGSADPNAPARWKLSAAAGGGVIADLASHVLDLVDHLAGPIEAVMAETHTAYAQRPSPEDPSRMVPIDAEDCVLILARLQSGAPGTIEATKIASGDGRRTADGDPWLAGGVAIQSHGSASPGVLRRDCRRSAAGRHARMESDRHRPALPAPRRRVSQPQSGHRLDPRARGLPGQFPPGRRPGACRGTGPRTGHSRAAVDGEHPAIGHRAAHG